MEDTGDVLFGRAAFGGFNRRDVMDYIDKLQRAAAKRGDPDLRAQIERELDALERENRCLRAENERLRGQLRAQTADAQSAVPADAPQTAALADDVFSATAETVREPDAKGLSMRDVDEMVQKYFG